MTQMPKPLTPAEVKERILGSGELALMDIREEGTFGDGHLLFAVPMPLSRLEMMASDLLPRQGVPIVLCAGGEEDDDLVSRATERLSRFGYSDVSYLKGGLKAWADTGFEVFTGVNVPSKAFGEFIELWYSTPHIPALELQAMMDRGDDLVIVDSRPMAEYENMSVPGGIDVPGAELALRIHDIAPDPKTTVVVNCAGRTRSIIGAQSLINAGIPNKVVALENGTMGWHLAGLKLDQGKTDSFSGVSENGLEKALACAKRVAENFKVPKIDLGTLEQWRQDESRTLYVLDVRDGKEYEAGHLTDAKPAPGGQLVQATDRYVGVRGARLVLVDDNGVRATLTASWLIQMGWTDVHVLVDGLGGELMGGPHLPRIFGLTDGRPELVNAKELAAMMVGGGAIVVDLADSREHRNGHIPASRFAIRANLPGNLDAIPAKHKIVLTSPDGILAALAAVDAASGGRDVKVLRGGTAAWKAVGQPLATGFKDALDDPVDVWYRPYDLDEGNEDAMKTYLGWEVDLTTQVERDGTTAFLDFGAAKGAD
ncbi:MAG: rhodanese-like domain-containing protein [Proteobacteria bacterium]|nr:rhodanese-like domain-containing protein [Pseudomonadota bacterium]MDA1023276.1 rhodanese-like domain-containing protein [Pseudomonadota bacterium]